MSGSTGDNVASSSTLTEAVSESHQEIKALFCRNPHCLQPAPLPPGRKPSTSTHPPTFYNKHFYNHLTLQHVKHLPSLVQDLATNVDQALLTALEMLPPAIKYMTAEQRKWNTRNLSHIVKDEKGVANLYNLTTMRYCAPVASTLALHPKALISELCSLLLWTQSVSSSRYAIMDGELQIMDEVGDNEDGDSEDEAHLKSILDTMDSETFHIFEKMWESHSSAGTWEIKSIATGSDDVMNAVHDLGTFSWTQCTDELCFTSPKHPSQWEIAEHTVVGSDAQNPPWNLNVHSFTQKLVDCC